MVKPKLAANTQKKDKLTPATISFKFSLFCKKKKKKDVCVHVHERRSNFGDMELGTDPKTR